MKKLISCIIVLVLALIPCIAFACECNCCECTCNYEEEVVVAPIMLRATGKVNVRQWADIKSPASETLDINELVEANTFHVTDDDRVWAELRWNNGYVRGYVSMRYLEYAEKTNLPELARYMTVTGRSVYVREEANINASISTTVHRGDTVEVDYYTHTSDGRIWAACYLEDEYIGFISCKYLAPTC